MQTIRRLANYTLNKLIVIQCWVFCCRLLLLGNFQAAGENTLWNRRQRVTHAFVCLETFIKRFHAITDVVARQSGAFRNQRKRVANAEQTPQNVVTQQVSEEAANWS